MPDSVKAPAPSEPPVVQMTDISISFPGVKALDGVDFRMFPGEVHSLMGENGAGKSTMMKIVAGLQGYYGGEMLWRGTPASGGSGGERPAPPRSSCWFWGRRGGRGRSCAAPRRA